MDVTQTGRWARLKDLFAAALERPPSERRAFVAGACEGEADLERELLSLLEAAEVDDGFIERPAAERVGWADDLDERAWLGRRIEPYRIVGLAGRGGLSQVFRAVREGAEYEQQVAIKLLRPGLGGDALLRRFRAERRMLASLSHPNIAHFLDGGATGDGSPYLVMEFVEGRAIDDYCEAEELGLERRIDLFRALCGAVQYVHQHLMVHGDLKGGNVLVTSDGVVKLLDFGIAKLLAADASVGDPTRPATLMLLTPGYASPEQLRGEPITTSSDVYSLGALLYRLLTGATPYGADHSAPVVLAEKMAAGGPLPPSAAAERTGGAYAPFARRLRGDLDTIVLKALKTDPRERYASAQQFAEDLHRWLRGFPVEARPDSVGYRLRKWAQRNRAVAVLSGLAIVALLGGIAATSWQAHVAQRERARAERQFDAVRELSAVLVSDVYDAIAKMSGSVEARRLLVDNTLKYLQALERDARDSFEVRRDLALAYERLGEVQGAMFGPSLGERRAAIESLRRSLALREQNAREQPSLAARADLLRGQLRLVELLINSGDVAGARPVGERMARVADELAAAPGIGRRERMAIGAALMAHGAFQWSDGQANAGIATLMRAHEQFRRNAEEAPDDASTKRALALLKGRLGEAYNFGLGDLETAARYYRETVALMEPLVRADPDDRDLVQIVAYSRTNVAELENYLKRPREALKELDAALPALRRMRLDDPADRTAPFAEAAALDRLAESRLQLGEIEAARRTLEEAVPLTDPKHAAGVPYFQLIAGQVQSRLARAYARGAATATGAARADLLRRADAAAGRAVALLEPLAGDPQIRRDARWALEAMRAEMPARAN